MNTASQLWPGAQQTIIEKATAGTLTDKQRANAEWLGFEVPAPLPPRNLGLYKPLPAPEPGAADLAELVAGHYGPATAAQVFALPPFHALRVACDNPNRSHSIKNYAIWACGRAWAMHSQPFSKYASLSERSAANAARRVALEQARVAKANKAAELPPLTAMFYGAAPTKAPRYTTPEAANAHELARRQEWLTYMRSVWARGIRKVRRQLTEATPAEVAAWFTEWQRRGYGDYAYLLDFMHHKRKGVGNG